MAKALCTFVTTATRFDAGSDTGITTVESPTVTAENLILVAIRCNSTSVTVTGVTDTAGNTYAAIGSPLTSSVTTLEVWYAYNITGHAANFVTATFSGSVGSRAILAVEFQGVTSASDPLDATASATSGANVGTLASGSYTTSEDEELLVVMAQQESGSQAWYAYDPDHFGVVASGSDAVPAICCAMKVVTAIQSAVTTTISSTQSVPRQMRVATFTLKDATGGGGAVAYGYA